MLGGGRMGSLYMCGGWGVFFARCVVWWCGCCCVSVLAHRGLMGGEEGGTRARRKGIETRGERGGDERRKKKVNVHHQRVASHLSCFAT